MSTPFVYQAIRLEDRLDVLSSGHVITTNKGDIITDNGTKSLALSVGTNNQFMIADSAQSTGIKWGTLTASLMSDFETAVSNNTDVSASTTHRNSNSGVHGITGAVVGTTDAQTLTNKSLVDSTTYIINSTDGTKKAQFALSGITTGTTRTFTLPDASATLVGVDTAQTLSNKTLTTPKINDSGSYTYNFAVSALAANRIVTLPTLAANDTFVFEAQAQTVTNKTINASNNTITNLADANIIASAGINVSKIGGGSVTNTEFSRLSGILSSAVGVSDTQTLTNKTLTDSTTLIQNSTDNSKKVQFLLSGISTSTTRVVTFPDSNITLVGTAIAQTLTNKTVDAANNTVLNIANTSIKSGAAIDATKIADGSVDNTEFQYLSGVTSAVVSINNIQTLQNKTLIDANTYFADNTDSTKKFQFQVSGVSTSTTRTLTVPNETTTIVGTNATQSLTNKSFGDNLNMANNRIINIAEPVNGSDAATKTYVDATAQGLQPKEAVKAKTDTALPSYTQSGTGTGATLTANANGTLPDIDGVTLVINDRILVDSNGSTNDTHNGIYAVTQVGDVGSPWVLTRATDADTDAEVQAGMFVFVTEGTTAADSGFILTTNDPITVDTTELSFTQFSGAGQIIAGTGMTKTNNTLDVVGSSTIIANANDLEVNSSSTVNQILLSTGTVGVAATFGALPLANSNSVSGILGLANGGTNASSFSTGSRLIATNSGNTALEDTSLNPANIVTLMGTQILTNKTLTLPKIYDTSADNTYNFAVSELTSNRTVTLPLLTNNDTFVFESHTQTLNNKTLTTPKLNDASSNNTYNFAVSELAADRTITLPLLANNDTFVFESHVQTLSNKTLTLPEINDSSSDHQYIFAVSELTADRTVTLPLLTTNDTFVFASFAQTLTNKTFTDSLTYFQDGTDNSKKLQFELSGITTSTTRVLTLPDANLTVVGTDTTQTLTNKTVDIEYNTVTNIANANIKAGAAIDATKIADGSISNAEFQRLDGVTSSVVGVSDTQTLTNKTLTDATTYFQDNTDTTKKLQFQLSGITTSTTRVLTIPNADTTIVGVDVAQTLTNKTINFDSNTITNISNGNIKSGAAIDASKIADGSVSNTEFQYLSILTSNAVGVSDVQTLTNKTLSSPKVETAIFDTNGNEVIKLGSIGSAVNEVSIQNAITGVGPTISATGNNTNINLNILPKGTGNIVLSGLKWPASDGNADQVLKTDGGGNITFADVPVLSITTATTTDGTTTTLATSGTSSGMVYMIEAKIVARRTDSGNEGAGYVITGFFRNDSGTLIKLGEDQKYNPLTTAWIATTAISGTNIIVQVTGEASKTVNWKCSTNVISVG